MTLERYVIGDVIGKGSYGEVTLARHKKDKKQYVIKKIDFHNASAKERLYAQQEVDILSKLKHPNIVSYKESFQTEDGGLSIVMGYCELGDLYCQLKKQCKRGEFLSETKIVEWFVQIAMALQYMHDRHILHRDLKTQNIFLTKSKIIKLGDLGIARVLESNCDMATTMIGTPYYMSPELFSNKPYNHKSDVWALGCCLYEMCTLKHAFNARDMNSLVYKILKGKTPDMPSNYSSALRDIIKNMLSYDPALRPSASRILRLPYIKKQIALFLEGTKNQRHLREERKSKEINVSHYSGFSESSNGESQCIATTSKIEVEIERQKKNPIEVANEIEKGQIHRDNYNGNDIHKSRSNSPKHNDKILFRTECKSNNLENIDNNNDHPNSVHVRKVLNDRIQAKARSKRCDIEEEKANVGVKCSNNHQNALSKIDKQPNIKVESKPRRQLPILSSVDAIRVLPQFRHSSLKTDSSKQTAIDEGKPKVCAPNTAARKKRRLRQQQSDSYIHISPQPSNKDGVNNVNQIVSFLSHQPRTKEEIIREHLLRASVNPSGKYAAVKNTMEEKDDICEKDEVDGPVRRKSISLKEDSSDEEDTITASVRNEKNNYDVSSLIDELHATLTMGSKSNECDGSQDFEVDKLTHFNPSATGRLHHRIQILRKECIDGIGEELLQKAYEIINELSEDDVEKSLIGLLGKTKFEEYGAQIWQLKFCEEF